MPAVIRKIVVTVEETCREAGHDVTPHTRKAAAVAVIENPFAGKRVDDLSPSDRDRRGTGRPADEARGRSARHRGRQGRELW